MREKSKYFFNLLDQEKIWLVVLILISIFSNVNIVLEDYGAFTQNMAKGQYADVSIQDFYFLAYTGLYYIIRFLTNIIETINWIGFLDYAPPFIAFYLLLKLLKHTVYQKIPAYLYFILQVIFTVFFSENIYIGSISRATILLAGSSMLYWVMLNPKGLRKFIILIFMVVSILIRNETATLSFSIVFMAILLYEESILTAIKKLWLPGVLICSMAIVSALLITQTDKFLYNVEPDIEYELMQKNNIKSLSAMNNSKDSLRYEMAIHGMWIDNDFVSVAFMRSLILEGPQWMIDNSKTYLLNFISFLEQYPGYISYIVLVIILFLFHKPTFKQFSKITIFTGFIFAILFYLSSRNLLAPRHAHPILLCSTFILTMLIVSSLEKIHLETLLKKCIALLGLFTLLQMTFVQVNKSITRYDRLQQEVAHKIEFRKYITEDISNQTVILTLSAINFHDDFFSMKRQVDNSNRYIMYDMFNYSKLDIYVDYLQNMCKCNPSDPLSFLQWVSDEGHYIVINDTRKNLYERYAQLIGNRKLEFIPAKQAAPPHLDYNSNQLYKIRLL